MGTKKQLSYRLLTDYFHAMSVPVCHNCIGTEYELIGLKRSDLSRLPYRGKAGINAVLNYLLSQTDSEPIRERNKIIGMENAIYSITIEPGGQLEASFAITESIAELEEHLNTYIRLLQELEDQGIIFIASGLDPFNSFSSVSMVPKQRYRLMWDYWYPERGLSCYMMTMTASIHINIDYNSEADAVRKFNRARDLQTLLGGMFANSRVYKNRLKKTASLRGLIWEKTDQHRTGEATGWNQPILSFHDYADRALDTPMLFIFENARYHRVAKDFTFRRFMETGYRGYFPRLKDWLLHLNTIFLPIRFNKSILELRFFDCNQPNLLLAMNALVKGIFYSKKDLKEDPGREDLLDFARNNLTPGERKFLQPIAELTDRGLTPADRARQAWEKSCDKFSFGNYLRIR